MSDKITSLAQRAAARKETAASSATKFFSVVRGEIAEVALDIRFRDGQRISMPYTSLQDVHYVPINAEGKEQITLDFTLHYFFTIEGKGLSGLYEALTMHSVRWLREMLEVGDQEEEEDGVLIEGITAAKMTDPILKLAELDEERRLMHERHLTSSSGVSS